MFLGYVHFLYDIRSYVLTDLCEVLFDISVSLGEQFSTAMLFGEGCNADGICGVQLSLQECAASLYDVHYLPTAHTSRDGKIILTKSKYRLAYKALTMQPKPK